MNLWDKLQFLIGSWSSPVSGQPGKGVSGSTTLSYDLDKKVIIRGSRAEFAPEPGATRGLVHDDILVIYQQPGEVQLQAIYFDNEDHIIHYTLTFPAKQRAVVFESEASQTSPRARLVYELAADGTFGIEFFVAPPRGELQSHLKGTVERKY